jgi:small GTP-binding protein
MTRIERLRNIGISAHIDSGKTTLTERMLYFCGRIHEIHEVRGSDGIGATMDSDPIERKRGITISSAVTSVDWKEHVFQIIDTPGHVDFTVEVERSLRVLDGAVLVLCSVGGVQSQSYTVDQQMRRYGVPRIAFINKMDRVGADPKRVIQEMRSKLKTNAVALQLPIGNAESFNGVIDLVAMKAVYFDGSWGEVVRREQIPLDLAAAASSARGEMLEAIALVDDKVMECLLSEREPSVDELRLAIRRATIAHQMTPVLLGSASKNCAVQELLDGVACFLPAPSDRQMWAYDLRQRTDGVSASPKIALSSDSGDATVAMAFKTIVEDFGPVTYIRVYQGQIEKGQLSRIARCWHKSHFSPFIRFTSAAEVRQILEACLSHIQQPNGYALPQIPDLIPHPLHPSPKGTYRMIKFAAGMLTMVLIAIVASQFPWVPKPTPAIATNVPVEIQLDVMLDVPEISEELAERLIGRAENMSLTKVTTLSPKVAAVLAKHPGNLSFPAIEQISPEVAHALVSNKESLWIALTGLKEVSPELASSFAKAKCALDLSGVDQLTPDSAEILANGNGTLKLGLQSMTPEIAARLANHENWLSLDSLRHIDVDSAKELAKHRGWLSLDSLSLITPEVAKTFGQFNGDKLELGLTSLDLETAKQLADAKCRSGLYLDQLKTVTAEIIEVLANGNNIISFQGLKMDDASTIQALKPVVEGLRAKRKVVLMPRGN